MKNISCDICNTGNLFEVLKIRLRDRFEKKLGIEEEGFERSWSKCNYCGIHKNVMLKNNEGLLSLIGDKYYEIDLGFNLKERFAQIMALKKDQSDNNFRVKRIVKFLEEWMSKEEKLNFLDIGSGLGVFPVALKRALPNRLSRLVCIEPDPIAASHLRSLDEFEVQEIVFEGGDSFSGQDFISLNKVLEHVADPLEMLKKIRSSLKEYGILYVEVPHSATTKLRPPDDNILGSLHKYLFNIGSLGYVLEQSGLEVIHSSTIIEPSGKITCYSFATPDLNSFLNSSRK